jgi:thymidylate synthase (FAD)
MIELVKLVWATPDIDKHLGYIARVSNPANQANDKVEGLFAYMMREGHTSPFEMANVCLEINTTRDIGRQILRHRSFSFQEFSQRYQDVATLGTPAYREARLQDTENRQNSISTEDDALIRWWELSQSILMKEAGELYRTALAKGIAKEQARALLPEGLTPSRMYMNGNLRSWIFYLKARLDKTTQKEHRLIAHEVLWQLRLVSPKTMEAFFPVTTCDWCGLKGTHFPDCKEL